MKQYNYLFHNNLNDKLRSYNFSTLRLILFDEGVAALDNNVVGVGRARRGRARPGHGHGRARDVVDRRHVRQNRRLPRHQCTRLRHRKTDQSGQ